MSVIPPGLYLVRAEKLSRSKLIAFYRLVAICPAALLVEESAFRGVNQQAVSFVALWVEIDVVRLIAELRYQRRVLAGKVSVLGIHLVPALLEVAWWMVAG